MTLSIGFKTDVGRKRKNNQDSFAVLRGAELNGVLDALLVVADGMGGRRGGEVASRIVVQTLLDTAKSFLAEREEEHDTEPIDVASLLQDMVARADVKVRQRQEQEPEFDGMGTTCLAAILDANLLTVANVGDSRGYLLREGRLTQITEDHSEVWQEVKAGHMTREEAQRSRFRNVITRAIGVGPNATPDVETHRLQEGDTILLCSDGLTSEIGDPEIARLLAGIADPQEACDRLVEAALRHGGKDNVTLVVLRYGEFTPVALPETEWDEEEEDTDPVQAWRTNPPRLSYEENRNPREAAREVPRERPQEAQRVSSPERSPLTGVLLALLLLIALGEGAGILYLWQYHNRIWPPPIPEKPAPKPTEKELYYGSPAPVLSKWIRDTPLVVDAADRPLVVTQEGTILQVESTGQTTPVSNQSKIPALPAEEGTKSKPAPGLLMAMDASGNRYQYDPNHKAIEKYTREGTRKRDDIGSSAFTAPTAMAVNSQGDIYVIDDHHLKRIKASDLPIKPQIKTTPKENAAGEGAVSDGSSTENAKEQKPRHPSRLKGTQ